MRLCWATLVPCFLLVAGCAEDDPPGDPIEGAAVGADDPDAHLAAPETQLANGTKSAASPPAGETCRGTVSTWPATTASENDQDAFAIPAGTAALVVELRWSDPSIDLDLRLTAPVPPDQEVGPLNVYTSGGRSFDDCSAPSGDAYASVRIDDAQLLALEGDWIWSVGLKGLVQDEAFTVARTFLPAGYDAAAFTALPPA